MDEDEILDEEEIPEHLDPDEARSRLEELAERIYDTLDRMEEVLEAAGLDGALDQARAYWMAHIDGALLNRRGLLGGSFISLADTLEELEGDEEDEG